MTARPEPALECPSCVLLDMDNTIYEYAPAHAAGVREVENAAVKLANVSAEDFRKIFDGARSEIKRRLGKTAASHHRLLYFQRTLERLGLASQPAIALKLEQAYWSAFLDTAELKPQVHEFLDDLRLLGVPLVVLTDLTSEIQFRKFLLWKLDRYVDWIVTSEEAGADKPDARMFEFALAKLGGVEGQVWMIGDNPDADIAGAKAAVGAITFQMMHGPGAACDAADFAVTSFSEIRSILRRTKR